VRPIHIRRHVLAVNAGYSGPLDLNNGCENQKDLKQLAETPKEKKKENGDSVTITCSISVLVICVTSKTCNVKNFAMKLNGIISI
jgi:hypothetical protein